VQVQKLETTTTTKTTRGASSGRDVTPGADQARGSLVAGPSSPHAPTLRRSPSPNAQYQQQPLFLEPSQPAPMPRSILPPPLSQLSAADAAVIRDTGLGIEDMDYDQFVALMEDEGEEVIQPHAPPSQHIVTDPNAEGNLEGVGDMDITGTQLPADSQPRDVMSKNGKVTNALYPRSSMTALLTCLVFALPIKIFRPFFD
jgi:hypothetical protein